MLPPRGIEDVTRCGVADDEMARRDVTGWDAQDASDGSPRFFRQPGKERADASGRFLPLVLECPDPKGLPGSWRGGPADGKERAKYGRTR